LFRVWLNSPKLPLTPTNARDRAVGLLCDGHISKADAPSAGGARGNDRDRSGCKTYSDSMPRGSRPSAWCPPVSPPLRIPSVPAELLPRLCAEAAGVALIGFSSMMLTARSFAAKNRYEIDVDCEFAALGAANIAAALSQGFVVSGADSRTAMSDAAGGRTRVTGLVTAAAVAAVLLFFTVPLQYVPVAALGAALVKAASSLLDLRSLKSFYQVHRRKLALSGSLRLFRCVQH
jgi:hypothetical protein